MENKNHQMGFCLQLKFIVVVELVFKDELDDSDYLAFKETPWL